MQGKEHFDLILVSKNEVCDGFGLGFREGSWTCIDIRAWIIRRSYFIPMEVKVSIWVDSSASEDRNTVGKMSWPGFPPESVFGVSVFIAIRIGHGKNINIVVVQQLPHILIACLVIGRKFRCKKTGRRDRNPFSGMEASVDINGLSFTRLSWLSEVSFGMTIMLSVAIVVETVVVTGRLTFFRQGIVVGSFIPEWRIFLTSLLFFLKTFKVDRTDFN